MEMFTGRFSTKLVFLKTTYLRMSSTIAAKKLEKFTNRTLSVTSMEKKTNQCNGRFLYDIFKKKIMPITFFVI